MIFPYLGTNKGLSHLIWAFSNHSKTEEDSFLQQKVKAFVFSVITSIQRDCISLHAAENVWITPKSRERNRDKWAYLQKQKKHSSNDMLYMIRNILFTFLYSKTFWISMFYVFISQFCMSNFLTCIISFRFVDLHKHLLSGNSNFKHWKILQKITLVGKNTKVDMVHFMTIILFIFCIDWLYVFFCRTLCHMVAPIKKVSCLRNTNLQHTHVETQPHTITKTQAFKPEGVRKHFPYCTSHFTECCAITISTWRRLLMLTCQACKTGPTPCLADRVASFGNGLWNLNVNVRIYFLMYFNFTTR